MANDLPAKKKNVDDPELRSLAAPYKEEVDKIWQDVKSGIYPPSTKNLFRCIRFFAQYAKYLPDCSNNILNMCRASLLMIENNTSDWDSKVLNKLLVICTTLLITRKEENTIRASCNILIEILLLLPTCILNPIVQMHAKTLSFIFTRLATVQTSYTQVQILRVFLLFTQGLPQLCTEVVSKHRLITRARKEISQACLQSFNQIDIKNYHTTSRQFLMLFNTYLVREVFILSTEGFITKINERSVEDRELMSIDFNGRNLTVSFLAPKKLIFNLDTKLMTEYGTQDLDRNQMVFVEIECANIEARMKKPNCDKLALQIEIKVARVIHVKDDNNIEQRIFKFDNISFVMVDTETKVKCFMDVFYNRYRMRERMALDLNNSILDQESVMSYNTNGSMLSNKNELNFQQNPCTIEDSQISNRAFEHPKVADQFTQQENVAPKVNEPKKITNIKSEKPAKQPIEEKKAPAKRGRKPKATKISATQESKVTRPKRQSTKKTSYKEELDLPTVEDKLPSYRDFMSKKREERLVASQIDALDDFSDNDNFVETKPRTKTTTRQAQEAGRAALKRSHHEAFNEDVFDIPQPKERKAAQVKNVFSVDNRKVKQDEMPKKRNPTKFESAAANKSLKIRNKQEDSKMNGDVYDLPKRVALKEVKPNVQKCAQNAETIAPKGNRVSKRLSTFDEMAMEIVEIMDASAKNNTATMAEETHALKKISIEFDTSSSRDADELQSNADMRTAPVTFVHPEEVEIPKKKRRLTVENVVENTTSNPKLLRVAEWIESASSQVNEFYSESSDVNITDDSQQNDSEEVADEASGVCNRDNNNNFIHDHSSLSSLEEEDTKIKTKNFTVHFDESFNPCSAFRERSGLSASDFKTKFERLNKRKRELDLESDPVIKKLASAHLQHVNEVKTQVNTVLQLNKRYVAAKDKLAELLKDKEESSKELKMELKKRRTLYDSSKHARVKELEKFRKEINETHETLKQDIWREYVDEVQNKMYNSFKKAFEI